MRKAQRIRESCEYKRLIDGYLIQRTRRYVQTRNVHQIVFTSNKDAIINSQPLTHQGNAFLIGIMDYNTHGTEIHRNHAVSALLIQGRLYCFDALGSDSKPMGFLVEFLRRYQFQVDSFIQYSGPNLQLLDERGVCTVFAARFLELNPNVSMNQQEYNEYIVKNMSKYTIQELYKYIERVASIRNVGSVSRNNNKNQNRKRKNVQKNMNVNQPVKRKNVTTRMNINRNWMNIT